MLQPKPQLIKGATGLGPIRVGPWMGQWEIKTNGFTGHRHSSFRHKEGAVAIQEIHRERTPRRTDQSNLRWGTAKSLTPAQAAYALQVSESRVLRWLKNGDLGGLKTNRRWYVLPHGIELFLEARANVPRS